jgi:hypothetical protein
MPHTDTPPSELLTPDDVQALRDWAFARLASGGHDGVLDVLAGYSELGHPTVEGFAELEVELYLRIGIATNRPYLVAISTEWLVEPAYEDPPPRMQFLLSVGAAWQIGLCPRADRLRRLRRLLRAARTGLQASLASGLLDDTDTAECRAALAELYDAAFRTADVASRPVLPATASGEIADAWLRLRGVRRSTEPGAASLAALEVLRRLATWCEPRWPVVGGPWWTSERFGFTINLAEPAHDGERHRFALADVVSEAEDVYAQLELSESGGEDDDALVHERALVDLAEEALAHACLGGLVDPHADIPMGC